jgi:Transglycosylase-like domain
VNDVSAGQAYLGFAENKLESTVSTLNDDRHSLSVASKTESTAIQSAETAAQATESDRSTVLSSVRTEQQLLSSVNGQLAALIAQQAAAQAAAAAAAAARAAAAAAATSTTIGTSTGTASATSGTTPPQPAPTTAGPPSITSLTTSASPIPSGSLSAAFAGIRNCESSDDYSLNTGNGYYGAYQFSIGAWDGVGESGLPSAAAPAVQDTAAYSLYKRAGGFSPWPECAAILGLR